MKIFISDEAHYGISSIFEYISHDSLKYANETSKMLYSKIINLKFSPYLGRYVPELSNRQYRELLYKSYRIIYSISEETSTIYIHFVVHSKRNFNSFYNSYISKK